MPHLTEGISRATMVGVPTQTEPPQRYRVAIVDRHVRIDDLRDAPERAPEGVDVSEVNHATRAYAEALAGRQRQPDAIRLRFAERRLHATVLELFAAAKDGLGDGWRSRLDPTLRRELAVAMAVVIASCTYGAEWPALTPAEVAAWMEAGGLPGRVAQRTRDEGIALAIVVAWQQVRAGIEPHRDAAAVAAVRQRLVVDPSVPL